MATEKMYYVVPLLHNRLSLVEIKMEKSQEYLLENI